MPLNLEGQRILDNIDSDAIAVGLVNHIVGDTATLLQAPANAKLLVVDVEVGNFRVKLGDYSATGAVELVTNGAFATDTDWTKGTGWTISAGTGSSDATQTVDSDLEQTLAVDTLIEGESYDVSFDVSGYLAGNVTPVVGGTEGTDRAANGTHVETIVAGSSQVIALRADLNFNGSVDNFTITKTVLAYTAAPTATAFGTGSLKLRLDADPRVIPAMDNITVVGSAAGDTLTYYWL